VIEHIPSFLAGFAIGMVFGFVGIAIGYSWGKADGIIKAMKAVHDLDITTKAVVNVLEADAKSAIHSDPYDAIRDKIRAIESGEAGPFHPIRDP
jgi:hypothetical protein